MNFPTTTPTVDSSNHIQGIEQIWESVAYALKVVAESRGWQHYNHFLLNEVANQLGDETGQQTRFYKHMAMANALYRNIYEDLDDGDKLESHRQDAQEFVCLIDQARIDGPTPYKIRNEAGQRRIGHLLGLSMPSNAERSKAMLNRLLPVGTFSEVGFSLVAGYKVPR